VFGHIVEIYDVNAAKKRIGDDTNKPIDKALKHVTNQEPPRAPHFAVSAWGCQRSAVLTLMDEKRIAIETRGTKGTPLPNPGE